METEIKTCDTYHINIYSSGLSQTIKDTCSKFCLSKPLCVNIREGEYIYDGGREESVTISIAAFPKKPRSNQELDDFAMELALLILEKTHQNTIMVQTPKETHWIKRK